MSDLPFVNRTDDLSDVLSLLHGHWDKPFCLFLEAASGIGKSRFMDEVAQRHEGRDLVRVRIRRSRGSRLEDGVFLTQIAAALQKAAETGAKILSIEEFNKNLKAYLTDEHLGLEVANELLKELDVPLVRQIKGFLERRFSLGEFKPEELLDMNGQAAVTYLKRYVRAVVEHHPVGLILENIHLIDEATLGFLVEDVTWRKDSMVLCEITQIEAQSPFVTWSLGELVEEFDRAGFTCKARMLLPLTYTHYAEVARNMGVTKDQRLSQVYHQDGGDLRGIHNLAKVVRSGAGLNATQVSDGDSYAQLFKTMSRDERFLAVTLHLHDGAAPAALLDHFMDRLAGQGLDPDQLRVARMELALNEMITLGGGQVAFAHDGLARAMEDLAPPAMVQIARKTWIDVYGDQAETDDQWLFQLRLAIEHCEEHTLHRALSRLEAIGDNSHFRDRIVAVLEAAATLFGQQIAEGARDLGLSGLRKVAGLLFELEAYASVALLLDRLELSGEMDRLARTAVAGRLDQVDETLALTAPEQLAGCRDHTGFAVVRLAALASIHQRDAALALYRQVVARPETPRSPYFPYLLRNADIFLSYGDSLAPLRQSAELFAARGQMREAAHSRNALGMQLGRLGRLDEASAELAQAEQMMTGQATGHAQMLNNRGVIQLSAGQHGEGTRILFLLARDGAQDPFDRIVLAQNLAVVGALTGDPDTEALFAAAERLLTHHALSNQGLWRSLHWNWSRWASAAGDAPTAEARMEKARGIDMIHTDLWQARLFGTTLPDGDSTFLAGQPFHYSFLSKWHFPLDLNRASCSTANP
ncbi:MULTISPECIES: hypothetical protein [Roseobacteraceae]|jgi:hypothetical protein|uniref:Flp pilus assembly protein TadD, contains TPR repeats n=1 Tax=Celeribacter baekdonensis TaxID=875171 RepID=A0A1G7T4I0_9RHOB|nr:MULTISPECIES: hypothetical protein [Roseobacteraceae]MBU0643124.1 hypothetical protein [Alphaproteobacteria bacterium]AVW90050.1 hypothetical protein DA792_02335 [Celeribacter baekdonensis]KAB6717165.1 hypothetical protein C8029_05825 [Roseobacter sp. TSBP12]MBU1280064.1 hypothetical protein [Alphaproteobacteria bacterium]MBU1830390.1 hypothetical protein [Alphaproteobacteria bacterium]|tara:strand:+ start:34771 stop:37206 length:2436 start_codon:yes stop_codon:yes gene_type:complete